MTARHRLPTHPLWVVAVLVAVTVCVVLAAVQFRDASWLT